MLTCCCHSPPQVERALKSLEASVQTYNTIADRLQLIPATAKRAERITYEIFVNRAVSSTSDLISVDLKVSFGLYPRPLLASYTYVGNSDARVDL